MFHQEFEAQIKMEAAQHLAELLHFNVPRSGRQTSFDHVAAVANAVPPYTARTVAWLHDVLEDTPITLDILAAIFGDQIATHVDILTRKAHQTYPQYIDLIRTDPIATEVKLADIAHNLSTIPSSMFSKDKKSYLVDKYATARERLVSS